MIFRVFRDKAQKSIIAALYGTIVAQARAVPFYQAYAVPDTLNGRLEMVMLHTFLLLRRLEQGEGVFAALGQAVFDRFCSDMDESMREMGVGDLAVPRKMRRIGEAFYARQTVYQSALISSHDAPLVAALRRNIYPEAEDASGARRLAAYIRATAELLAAQDGYERGELVFPDPALIALPEMGIDETES